MSDVVYDAVIMPTLRNPRHELFCQLIPQSAKFGWSQGEIYQRAGFKARGHSAETLGCKLLKNVEVQRRIAELQAPAARKAGVTTASLLDELRAAYEGAMSTEQFSAATSAAMSRAKLAGLLVDQVEIGGVGEFGGCQTTQDVVAALLSDQTPGEALQSLALLQQEIEAFAANNASVIPAAEPARPREPGTEADRSLALFRRRR
jgi:hypothetical protein